MTRQKPPGVSFETWVEQQIRLADAEGAFQDLPGSGKPLRGLGEVDDPSWWARNLVRREGLSVVPPAVEIRRTVERVLDSIEGLSSEAAVRERLETLNEKIARLNATVTSGPPTTVSRLDVEAVVARWRKAREGR